MTVFNLTVPVSGAVFLFLRYICCLRDILLSQSTGYWPLILTNTACDPMAELHIFYDDFSSFEEIEDPSKVREIYLEECSHWSEKIESCRMAEVIVAERCVLGPQFLEALGTFPHLRKLCLNSCASTPEEMAEDQYITAFPPLSELKSLSFLDVTENRIKSIPEFIRNMNLEVLEVCDNIIKHLPVSNLPVSLKTLNASRNEICNLPPNWERLTELQEIDISNNQLRSVPCLGKLPALTALNISDNLLGSFPESLPWAARPYLLYADGCGIHSLPENIKGADQVKVLSISRNPLKILPEQISGFDNLETLIAVNCELVKITSGIGNLHRLKSLTLSENLLTELPDVIGELSALIYLNVQNNRLHYFPEGLCRCRNLEYLNANWNRLTQVFDRINHLSKLRILNLFKNQILFLPENLSGLISLEQMEIGYNPLKTLPDMSELPNIGYLGLAGLREMDWKFGFEKLGNLKAASQITLTNNSFGEFDEKIFLIPRLARVDLNKTSLGKNMLEAYRKRYPNIVIWYN